MFLCQGFVSSILSESVVEIWSTSERTILKYVKFIKDTLQVLHTW